jgi:hypothetical protein
MGKQWGGPSITRAAFSIFDKKKGVMHHEDRSTKAIFL